MRHPIFDELEQATTRDELTELTTRYVLEIRGDLSREERGEFGRLSLARDAELGSVPVEPLVVFG